VSLRSLFNTNVQVEYPTVVRGTEGGQDTTWTVRYASLACRIQPLSAREAAMYGRETVAITHRMYCFPTATINGKDKITYGGRTFLVKGVRDTDEQERLQVVELEEQT